MSALGDALKALRNVLLLQEEVRMLKETAQSQSARLTKLAEAHGELRDRVSRLEGVIEGAAMAARQRRIEE
jgi:uncharacterized protein YdcH (DUF465 family)